MTVATHTETRTRSEGEPAWPEAESPLAAHPTRYFVPLDPEFAEGLLAAGPNGQSDSVIYRALTCAGAEYFSRHIVEDVIQADIHNWQSAYRRTVVEPLQQAGLLSEAEAGELMDGTCPPNHEVDDPRYGAFLSGIDDAEETFYRTVGDRFGALEAAFDDVVATELVIAGVAARSGLLLVSNGDELFGVCSHDEREQLATQYLERLADWIRHGWVVDPEGWEPPELRELAREVREAPGWTVPDPTSPEFGWALLEAGTVKMGDAGVEALLQRAALQLESDRLALHGLARETTGFDHEGYRIIRIDEWAPRWAETVHAASPEAIRCPEGVPPYSPHSLDRGFSLESAGDGGEDEQGEDDEMRVRLRCLILGPEDFRVVSVKLGRRLYEGAAGWLPEKLTWEDGAAVLVTYIQLGEHAIPDQVARPTIHTVVPGTGSVEGAVDLETSDVDRVARAITMLGGSNPDRVDGSLIQVLLGETEECLIARACRRYTDVDEELEAWMAELRARPSQVSRYDLRDQEWRGVLGSEA